MPFTSPAPVVAAVGRRLGAPVAIGEFVWFRALLAGAIAWRLVVVGEFSAPPATGAVRIAPMLVGWLGAPPQGVLVAGRVLGVLLAVAVVARRCPRGAFRALVVVYAVLAAIVSSAGKIRHDDTLLLIACLPVAAASIGAIGYRDRSPDRDAGWPRRLALVALIVAYTVAGLQKIRWSGLGWAVDGNLSWVLVQSVSTGRPPWPSLTMWVSEQRLLIAGLALGTLALECGFSLALFRRLRPWFGLGAIGLHVSIWALMGLDYSAWILAAGVVLLPWERFLVRSPNAVATLGDTEEGAERGTQL